MGLRYAPESRWDRLRGLNLGEWCALVGVLLAAASIVVAVVTPEIRRSFGLDTAPPAPPPKQEPAAKNTPRPPVRSSRVNSKRQSSSGVAVLTPGEGFSFALSKVVRGHSNLSLLPGKSRLSFAGQHCHQFGPTALEAVGEIQPWLPSRQFSLPSSAATTWWRPDSPGQPCLSMAIGDSTALLMGEPQQARPLPVALVQLIQVERDSWDRLTKVEFRFLFLPDGVPFSPAARR